jgi:hypothetical protein
MAASATVTIQNVRGLEVFMDLTVVVAGLPDFLRDAQNAEVVSVPAWEGRNNQGLP